MLKDVNKVKIKMDNLYEKYLKELNVKNADKQSVNYKYLSNKRQLCQELFSALILIIGEGTGTEVIDNDEVEENKYED